MGISEGAGMVMKNVGGLAGVGFAALDIATPLMTYSGERKQGHGVGYSAISAAKDTVFNSILSGTVNSSKISSAVTGALGKGLGGSIAGGVAGLGGAILPFVAYAAITGGWEMLLQSGEANAEASKGLKYIGSGYVGGSGQFDMSNAGYTMRQRSIQKMRETGANINSVLGNESRNYIRGAKAIR